MHVDALPDWENVLALRPGINLVNDPVSEMYPFDNIILVRRPQPVALT